MEYIKQAQTQGAAQTAEQAAQVSAIVANVRQNGDAALRRYNEKFDGCRRTALRVSPEEIRAAYRDVPENDIRDIREAADNIRAFAQAQRETIRELPAYSPKPGITLGHRNIPVRACCCYVPGGSYPLYSSALMLVIPAKVAGVPRVAACSPAMKGTDRIHPKTLVAMDIAGTDEIYAVGGAHAIAAFSYGTEQIRPVDLIVGPGNSYVTEAKRQCFGQVGIDFIAGPSEVLVIADTSADPELIAADLLAQSEHDKVARSAVITTDAEIGRRIAEAVERQMTTLPTADIARTSWETYGEIILADSLDEAVALANERAPEHLEIQTAHNEELTQRLDNYGSLFIGQYTAEVFGDYASGTNHTLPTLRAARYTGGVWVGTFIKTCTHQTLSLEAMKTLGPLVSRLAHGEGLAAHARAAEIRFEKEVKA